MTIHPFHERHLSPDPGSGDVGLREPGLNADSHTFAPDEIERLARACLSGVEAAMDQVQQWQMAGHGLEDIYLHAVTPCARLLGDWWCCDTANFAQVSIASSQLQRLLHRLSDEFCAPGTEHPPRFSVLLSAEPKSQHTLGAFMLGEFFRRAGWQVNLLTPVDADDILSQLSRDWFDAVGLSVSTTRQLEVVRHLLPTLRQASPNPQLRILAGGPIMQWAPEALQSLDVDLLCGDARQTVQSLGHLMTAKSN